MTADQKRAAVVNLLRARIKKNQYTQGSKRNRVFDEPTGFGDCSSTVRAAYKKALGIDIGSNTAVQIVSKKGKDVDVGQGSPYPNERALQPGDCLYFRGTDTSRPFAVGHVEMYIGNGQLIGHGSGIGPTVKKLKPYAKARAASGRGYIKTRRFISDEPEEIIYPANPLDKPGNSAQVSAMRLIVTGETVNLRAVPSTDAAILSVVRAGDRLSPVNADGWIPVAFNGATAWISEKYVKDSGGV